jgi:hypothetical protein
MDTKVNDTQALSVASQIISILDRTRICQLSHWNVQVNTGRKFEHMAQSPSVYKY